MFKEENIEAKVTFTITNLLKEMKLYKINKIILNKIQLCLKILLKEILALIIMFKIKITLTRSNNLNIIKKTLNNKNKSKYSPPIKKIKRLYSNNITQLKALTKLKSNNLILFTYKIT